MKLTLIDLKKIFLEVIDQKRTFESASNWASDIIRLDEEKKLEFDPNENISQIFEGLTYLSGIDMLDISGEYFHSLENIQDEFNDLFKN